MSNAVTLTVTISSGGTTPPTGTVSFYDGTTLLGTAPVTAGVATYTTSTLASGTQSITAVYSGDSNYMGTASPPITETIEDFTIAVSGSGTSTAYSGGQPASYAFLIAPVGGSTLPAAVNMTVTGLPTGATAVFSPAAAPANSASASVSLQVSLPGQTPVAVKLLRKASGRGSLPMALGLILLPFAYRLRKTAHRWRGLALLALAGASLAVGLTGCMSVSSTPQTYSLTIAGTSGPLSHSTTAKLIVQLAQK
jgi:hypothetical protein